MRNKKSWTLVALLLGACAIPDVEIDPSLDGSSGGSASSDDGGTSNHAGKGSTGKAGSDSPITDAGADTGGTSSGGTSSGGMSETGQAGEPPSVGGTFGTSGKASGGSGGTRPAGGTGGTGGTGVPPAGAVAKFCNAVSFEGSAVDMELRVGSGASMVRIVATTGTCQPVVNHACTPIPTGSAVPVTVYNKSNNLLVWTVSGDIAAGDAWIFSLYFNDTTQAVEFRGDPFTAAQCAATDF
jgi:hypothetical protein